MQCPRCGADNSERAETCYLCGHPFGDVAAAAEPPAPGVTASPQYPPPGTPYGEVHAAAPAAPPPTAGGPPGSETPPPQTYVPSFKPSQPAPRGPVHVKVIIGVLVVVLFAVVGVGAYFLLRGKTYSIDVPAPPGYTAAEQGLKEELKDTLKAGPGNIVLDELFVDSSMSNFIFVAHQDIPAYMGSDAPSGEDPEEMERWFYDNRGEWIEAFDTGVVAGSGMTPEIAVYEVERLGSGDAVLRMVASIDFMGTPFKVETLWVIKGRTAFFIMVEGLSFRSDTVEFLKENVTFSER